MSRAVDHVCVAVINLTILVGCAYLVGWREWSPWWFLFAFLCMHSSSKVRAA